MMLISVELLMMLFILLFIPRYYAGKPCFINSSLRYGESLGASRLRIAGGILTTIAASALDLMRSSVKSRRLAAQSGGIAAHCTGQRRVDSLAPSQAADCF